jgi:hypothetical protein
MEHGPLAVVERWLLAVNARAHSEVLALTADDVEIVGPRGKGRGKERLADWLSGAGFTSIPLRWFCGEDGRVVVEQAAEWTQSGSVSSRKRVASAFAVTDFRVTRFERFDSLTAALEANSLTSKDEVVGRR